MNGTPLEKLLEGKQVQQLELEIVRTQILGRSQYKIEQRDGDKIVLIFDLLIGGAVERYEIPFGPDGWSGFQAAIAASTSAIEVPKLTPAGPLQ